MKKRSAGILLAALLAGSLAACGSQSTQNTDTGSAAEGESTASGDTTDYAEISDATGLAVRKWIGSFAECAKNEDCGVIPHFTMLDAEKGIRMCEVEVVVGDFPEGFDKYAVDSYDELDQYRTHYVFPGILFSVNQDMTEEELRGAVEQYATVTDYTLTAFTTESGLTMYQADTASTDLNETASEYESEETKALLEKLKGDWEEQRKQLDYVEYQSSSGISFKTVDYDGNAVDSSVFKNAKLTMVNIWATTCSFCIEEMPDLQALNDEMEDVQIITLLTDVRDINDEEGVEEAHDLMSAQGVTLPVLLDTDELDGYFPAVGTPTSYLVDQNGNILGRPKVGMASKEVYAKWIQEALDQMEE